MSEPFDPPTSADASTPTHQFPLVMGAWMLSGAACGISVGTTLRGLSMVDSIAAVGLVGIAAMFVGGLGAWQLERRHAATLPPVLDARGRPTLPLHAGLYAFPLLVALPSLLWLVVVGSVTADSLLPAVAFGMASIGLLWGLRKLWAGHRLTEALRSMERGDEAEAMARLKALESSATTTSAVRSVARLNLGLLAMADGDLDGAAHWYSAIRTGGAWAFAATSLALVRVLQERYDEAETLLAQVMVSAAGRSVQAQADAVRLLLVLRCEGVDEARTFGERMLGPGAGTLFMGILASARKQSGDPVGAAELLDAGTAESLRSSGLGSVVPELQAVL